MAEHFANQGKEYADSRPTYPPQLFQFIASKTPSHHLAWDVATGTGQAAKSLATLYENVIATDASEKQLEFAAKLPNIRYQHTPSTMSMTELEQLVSPQGTIDLVTIAQALHWLDLSTFYKQVNWVLKKPHGVIAIWCYTSPSINDAVDALHHTLYSFDARPHWDPRRELLEDNYRNIDFPFEPVEGVDHTGPFEFEAETVMDVDDFLNYIRSRSGYQISKNKGVELLKDDVVEKFKLAWGEDGKKIAKFQVYLRIGRVRDA
ncbi:putative methyltransferase DDB_G0268948 [Trifolium pratense]|uniref:putative methyltransferase DDB_G0268948 n=1 Tax=Trifolium pratense TaxID=57577 RepID=UPI001E694888|nr:putative methyltransferase DDB_G0268948 [Trifolium pratense]